MKESKIGEGETKRAVFLSRQRPKVKVLRCFPILFTVQKGRGRFIKIITLTS